MDFLLIISITHRELVLVKHFQGVLHSSSSLEYRVNVACFYLLNENIVFFKSWIRLDLLLLKKHTLGCKEPCCCHLDTRKYTLQPDKLSGSGANVYGEIEVLFVFIHFIFRFILSALLIFFVGSMDLSFFLYHLHKLLLTTHFY